MHNFYVVVALRLMTAVAGGAFVGLERTMQGHPAGFRTMILVSLGCCLLMMLGTMGDYRIEPIPGTAVSLQVYQIVQGVMAGIGFLGAGAIVKQGMGIRGLTTAASVWATAAIGLLLGAGSYYPAGI